MNNPQWSAAIGGRKKCTGKTQPEGLNIIKLLSLQLSLKLILMAYGKKMVWNQMHVILHSSLIQPFGLCSSRALSPTPNRCASLGVIHIQSFGLCLDFEGASPKSVTQKWYYTCFQLITKIHLKKCRSQEKMMVFYWNSKENIFAFSILEIR